MTLQETLNEMKQQFEANLPKETVETMHGATRNLAESGIMDRVLKPGEVMPSFILPDGNGVSVDSAQFIGKGPLVVTFYRGVW